MDMVLSHRANCKLWFKATNVRSSYMYFIALWFGFDFVLFYFLKILRYKLSAVFNDVCC